MTNKPVKQAGGSLEPVETDARVPAPFFSMMHHPLFSFQYTKQVISCFDQYTTVQVERHEYKDGRLSSEQFSGTMPGNPFAETVGMFQKQMLSTMAMFFKGFNLIDPR